MVASSALPMRHRSLALTLLLATLSTSGCGAPERELPARPLAPIAWTSEARLELPGPLGARGPIRVGESLLVPTAKALFEARLDPEPRWIEPSAALPEQPGLSERWSLADDGRARARIDARGRLELQRKCDRCRRGWRTRWRLRLPATAEVAPVLGPQRVFVGTLDNRVYAMRRKNGHRLWSADVGARVRRPLALVEGDVLVVPGSGERLLRLAAPDGSRRDTWSAPAGATIVGAPVALDAGRIALALQGYESADARLEIFAPSSPEAAKPAEDGL